MTDQQSQREETGLEPETISDLEAEPADADDVRGGLHCTTGSVDPDRPVGHSYAKMGDSAHAAHGEPAYAPDMTEQPEQVRDERGLEPETVKDLDVDEGDASDLLGGSASGSRSHVAVEGRSHAV